MTIGAPMLQLIDEAVKAERERTVALLLSYEHQLQAPQLDAEHAGNQRSAGARAQLDMLRLLIAALQR